MHLDIIHIAILVKDKTEENVINKIKVNIKNNIKSFLRKNLITKRIIEKKITNI